MASFLILSSSFSLSCLYSSAGSVSYCAYPSFSSCFWRTTSPPGPTFLMAPLVGANNAEGAMEVSPSRP